MAHLPSIQIGPFKRAQGSIILPGSKSISNHATLLMNRPQVHSCSEIPFQTSGDPVNLPSPVVDILLVVMFLAIPVIGLFRRKGKE